MIDEKRKRKKNYKLLFNNLFMEYKKLEQKYDTLRTEIKEKESKNNLSNIHDEKNICIKCGNYKNNFCISENKLKISKLEKLKKSYYNFDNKLLPEIDNIDITDNINKINTLTEDTNMIDIKIIIEFYYIFGKYLNYISENNIKNKESNFLEYIRYSLDTYDKTLYNKSHIYNKVKRCYNFIHELKYNVNEKDIIKLCYKTRLTFNKLYELKEDEYVEFINFLYEKINIYLDIEFYNKVTNKIYIKNRINKKNTTVLLNNYVGNKDYLLKIINKYHYVNKKSKIYDLFGGSLTISNYLHLIYPDNEIFVNEINPDIYNLYKLVKEDKNTFYKIFNQYNTENYIQNFNNLITEHKKSDNIYDKCIIYLLLHIISYNNYVYYDLYGNIKISSLNNKYIKKEIVDILEIETILECFCKYIDKIEINNHDTLSNNYFLDKINCNDLVILDPPYDTINNTNKIYNNSSFSRYNQEQLYLFIKKLHKKGCKIIAFNNNTNYIKKLYNDFNYDIIESYNKFSRKYKKELLIYN